MEGKKLKNLTADTISAEIRYGNHAPDERITMIQEYANQKAIHIAEQAIEWLENQKRLAKILEAPVGEQELLESILEIVKDARKQLTEQ